MRFPIKQGEIKYILTSELPEHFQYGIYRCMIQKITTRLFRYNKNNYYTHFDLERAKELGLKIEMIEDGENNFLHYDRCKLILGRQLFGKFIDKLYPLKEQGIDGAKDIMNCL